ncbi:MAG: hypothetical protein ABJA67_09320 [Chthonomonadales bacterium]
MGLLFEEAWPDREFAELEGIKTPVISLKHLIQNKRAANRMKDRLDIMKLTKLLKEKP